jgi:hypothetical protein
MDLWHAQELYYEIRAWDHEVRREVISVPRFIEKRIWLEILKEMYPQSQNVTNGEVDFLLAETFWFCGELEEARKRLEEFRKAYPQSQRQNQVRQRLDEMRTWAPGPPGGGGGGNNNGGNNGGGGNNGQKPPPNGGGADGPKPRNGKP